MCYRLFQKQVWSFWNTESRANATFQRFCYVVPCVTSVPKGKAETGFAGHPLKSKTPVGDSGEWLRRRVGPFAGQREVCAKVALGEKS